MYTQYSAPNLSHITLLKYLVVRNESNSYFNFLFCNTAVTPASGRRAVLLQIGSKAGAAAERTS